MTTPQQEKAYHKAQLYRLLMGILDNKKLAPDFFFKGGTCASMLNFLDRFSVDLDFDLRKGVKKEVLRKEVHALVEELGLEIKDESKKALQFFLKYPSPPGERNTLKLEVLGEPFEANDYEPQYLEEIERTAVCQTIETMFGNKLVAMKDRYEKRGTVAGRDLYDIHHFFSRGFDYKKEVIRERTGQTPLSYLEELKVFIRERVTQTVINQDLNFLLPLKRFKAIRRTLRQEALMLISDEIKRLKANT